MTPLPVRVVKLGGSLLDCVDLADRLRAWFATQPPAMNLLVVGGGRFADAVRHYDELLNLGEEAHWLAIRAMNLAATMLSNAMPEAGLPLTVDRMRTLLNNRQQPTILLVDTLDLVRSFEQTSAVISLPNSWDVTSDSIAAQLAAFVVADELVLLKSILPPDGTGMLGAMDCGLIDRYFPTASTGLRTVRLVNLRTALFPQVLLGQAEWPHDLP